MAYFKEVLNKGAQPPLQQQRQQQARQELQQQWLGEDGEENELTRPPTLEEVQTAIHIQKSHKAPGIDKISAELLKQGGRNLIQQMYQLIREIWIEEEIPQ
uniref:Uncharacterized protein LOC114331419 isoform X1 n=1 Tax=Diabrotica virgifera virgifera TaxID=50390 RepID=A0A6P7FV50_DIAVI